MLAALTKYMEIDTYNDFKLAKKMFEKNEPDKNIFHERLKIY